MTKRRPGRGRRSPAQLVLEKLKEIQPELRALKVKELYLFGSYARGTAVRGSDIDVLVEFSGRIDLFLLSDLRQLLEKSLGKRVDVVMKAALREEFKQDVEQEMIRVA